MDNTSYLNMKPEQIKINPNVNVSQRHIDNLFDGVGSLLNKYHNDNPLICDSECKKNKKTDAYYKIYLAAKDNLENAPDEFDEAEKNFYHFRPGGVSYANFKEKEANKQVKLITDKLTNTFDEKVQDIKEKIDSYSSQIIYSQNIKDLNDSYVRDIQNIDTNITNSQNRININDRLSTYYSEQVLYNKYYLYYFKIIYWMLLTTYTCYFLIYKKQIFDKKFFLLALLLIPAFIKPITLWLFPIKIDIPPRPPVCTANCPTKKKKSRGKMIIPDKPPSPKEGPHWTPPPQPEDKCPAPTLWNAFVNSLPQIGYGPTAARYNAERRVSNIKNDVKRNIGAVKHNISNQAKNLSDRARYVAKNIFR